MASLASALQPQTGGLLQRLMGTSGQSGLGQRLTDLLDPRVALPMAGAMMAGGTPGESIGNAMTLGGFGLGKIGEGRKADAEKQRTMNYLNTKHPELAQMVDMGLPIEDAWHEALKLDNPASKGLMNAGDGNLYNQDTGEWITAPGGGRTKAPTVTELFDEQGQPYKAQWNADTGTFDRLGGSKAPPVKAPTEQVVRNRQLYKVVAPEVKTLLGDGTTPGVYDSLATTANQAGSIASGVGKSLTGFDASGFLTSGDYQQAKNSIKTIYSSYIYSVSGASAPEAEVERQASLLMPAPGEDPQSIADKKRRIETMANAIKSVADGGGNEIMSPLPKGTTSGGVEWSIEQ